MTVNNINVSFADFAKAAKKRKYEAIQFANNAFYIRTRNNIRMEFKCLKGGVHTVGYTSSPKVLAALFPFMETAEKDAKFPLKRLDKNHKCSVNYAFESIDKFFDLADIVEKMPYEAKRRSKNVEAPKVAANPKKAAKKAATKTETVTEEPKVEVADIKAKNLARLKKVAKKYEAPVTNVIEPAFDTIDPSIIVSSLVDSPRKEASE